MENKFEILGQLIDDIESLACGLNIPMSDNFHVEQLKRILPDKVKKLKQVFIDITGEDPWS